MMVLVYLSTNSKSTLKSHDKSYDSHVRVGEWPEATTPLILIPMPLASLLLMRHSDAASAYKQPTPLLSLSTYSVSIVNVQWIGK